MASSAHHYLRQAAEAAATQDGGVKVAEISEQLKPYASAIAVVLIILGLVLAFWGKRALRVYAACTGFLTGAAAAYLTLEQIQKSTPIGNYEKVQLIACAITGLIGLLLFVSLIRLVVLGLGLLLGLLVSVAIMRIPDVERLLVKVPRPAVIVVAIVACVLVTVLLENFIVMLVTAAIGAIGVICGVDLFMETGLNQEISRVLTSRGSEVFVATEAMKPLLIAFPVLIVVALLVQLGVFHHTSKKSRSKEAARGRGGRVAATTNTEEKEAAVASML